MVIVFFLRYQIRFLIDLPSIKNGNSRTFRILARYFTPLTYHTLTRRSVHTLTRRSVHTLTRRSVHTLTRRSVHTLTRRSTHTIPPQTPCILTGHATRTLTRHPIYIT